MKRSYCIDSRSELTVIALGVSLQNVEMDYLSSFSDCAGAVSGFPTAEAPAAFPETGAYSGGHTREVVFLRSACLNGLGLIEYLTGKQTAWN